MKQTADRPTWRCVDPSLHLCALFTCLGKQAYELQQKVKHHAVGVYVHSACCHSCLPLAPTASIYSTTCNVDDLRLGPASCSVLDPACTPCCMWLSSFCTLGVAVAAASACECGCCNPSLLTGTVQHRAPCRRVVRCKKAWVCVLLLGGTTCCSYTFVEAWDAMTLVVHRHVQ